MLHYHDLFHEQDDRKKNNLSYGTASQKSILTEDAELASQLPAQAQVSVQDNEKFHH